jgi:hypothetical protein
VPVIVLAFMAILLAWYGWRTVVPAAAAALGRLAVSMRPWAAVYAVLLVFWFAVVR